MEKDVVSSENESARSSVEFVVDVDRERAKLGSASRDRRNGTCSMGADPWVGCNIELHCHHTDPVV